MWPAQVGDLVEKKTFHGEMGGRHTGKDRRTDKTGVTEPAGS